MLNSGKCLGEFQIMEDGYYAWWPAETILDAETLKEIVELLEDLNFNIGKTIQYSTRVSCFETGNDCQRSFV